MLKAKLRLQDSMRRNAHQAVLQSGDNKAKQDSLELVRERWPELA
jgi:hypothetical protein